jgi:hypothetical protein
MAEEQSKYTGVLSKLKQPPAEQPAETFEAPMVEASIVRGRGRPHAKSSDPDYQPTTVILRKVTKRRAAHLLEDREMGKDLSELIEELLTEWLQKHS